jgi:hypothetical protein
MLSYTSLSLQQGSQYPRHQSVAPHMTAQYSFFSSTPHFNDSRGVLQCVLAIKVELKSVKMSRSSLTPCLKEETFFAS